MPRPAQASDIDDFDPADAWERALLDHQIESLNRLAAMGMAIAGAIERQVTAAEPGPQAAPVLHQSAMDFGRVSRAVRLSFALQSRLIADFKTPTSGQGGADALLSLDDDVDEESPFGSDLPAAVRKKAKLGHLMRHIAQCAVPEAESERRETVFAQAAERLERDDIHRLIANRPYGEVIAIICRDLGLEPDWERIPHKPHRLGWATYDEIRRARDFSRSAEGQDHRSGEPEPTCPPAPDSA